MRFKKELADLEIKLIEKFRIYQVPAQEVTDQHTQRFEIPEKFFRALVSDSAKRPAANDRPPLVLRTFVSVDISDQAQMVGVAPQDFYLLAAEKWFWQNFLKGVLGIWCTHMLVLGVAKIFSVISVKPVSPRNHKSALFTFGVDPSGHSDTRCEIDPVVLNSLQSGRFLKPFEHDAR